MNMVAFVVVLTNDLVVSRRRISMFLMALH